VDYRIKPHIPPLKQIPANSVKFKLCSYTPQVDKFYLIAYHCLGYRLLGSQILFTIYTLVNHIIKNINKKSGNSFKVFAFHRYFKIVFILYFYFKYITCILYIT